MPSSVSSAGSKGSKSSRKAQKKGEKSNVNPLALPPDDPLEHTHSDRDGAPGQKTIGQAHWEEELTTTKKRKNLVKPRKPRKKVKRNLEAFNPIKKKTTRRLPKSKPVLSSSLESSSSEEESALESEASNRKQNNAGGVLSKEAMEAIIKNVMANVLLAGRDQPHSLRRSEDIEQSDTLYRANHSEPYSRAGAPSSAPHCCQSQYQQPLSQATPITICGTLVPEALQEKIINGKYIDLRALHPLGLKKKSAKTIQIENTDEDCKVRIEQDQEEGEGKKDLSEFEWLECFLDYMAIYTKEYPTATEGILSYTKFILGLMQKGKDWRSYDIKFRKARAQKSYLWTDILMDSRFDISDTKEKPTSLPPPKRQFFPSDRPQSTISLGYCFDYHNKNSRCIRKVCQYNHHCQLCDGPHPLFRHNAFQYPRRGNFPDNRRHDQQKYARPFSPRKSPDPHQSQKTGRTAGRLQ